MIFVKKEKNSNKVFINVKQGLNDFLTAEIRIIPDTSRKKIINIDLILFNVVEITKENQLMSQNKATRIHQALLKTLIGKSYKDFLYREVL